MVKYNLRSKPTSRTKAALNNKQVKAREEQLKVVKYCLDSNSRGYSAAKCGLFLLIKDGRTIDKQLGVEKEIEGEKEYCRYLY